MVGWDNWESEEARPAEKIIKQTVLKERIQGQPLFLHSDNGSPMKAATFRALKYWPDYPNNGFKTVDNSRKWTKKVYQ